MATTIASVINGIALNIFSCVVYDKGKVFLAHLEKEQIKERIYSWTEKFFSTHSEMVFESSQFYDYITYQKPFDKICRYVFDANRSAVTDEQGIVRNLTSECKKSIIDAGGNCSIPEESAIRDLFYGVLILCKEILSEETSKGEKLILYQNRQNNVKFDMGIKDISSKIDDLEAKLTHQDQISDPVIIEDAYKILSNAIWEGKLTKVYNFLPVLAGKNDDLESAVKIKLALLSDYDLLTEDSLALCQNIKNAVLRDDVFRLLILKNFFTPDKLVPYVEAVSDLTLKNIAVSIAAGRFEDVIIESKSKQNNITCYNCEIVAGMETEEWLTKRLCVLKLNSLPICNFSKTIIELVKQPNFIDQLYIWEHYLNEVIAFDLNRERANSEKFRDSIDVIKKSVDIYRHAQVDLQKRFYLCLIRGMLLAEDKDVKDVLDSIPQKVAGFPEIEAYKFIQEIREGRTDQDSIIRFVLRTEQYWVLLNYCASLGNDQKALDVINQVKWLLDQSFEIFEYAVITTSHAIGNQGALHLLKEHEKNYSDYIEFWVRVYQMSETDVDRQWAIDSVIAKMQIDECKVGSLYGRKLLADILIREKRFTEAISILTAIELVDGGNLDITYKKIEAYMNSGRQIDVLTEINEHYDQLKDDVRILDLLLSISLTNKRSIEDDVLAHAKEFSNARVLMLAAETEYIRKNINEAKKLAMQSMLISSLDNEEHFDIASKYFIGDDSTGDNAPKRIKENTFFVAENQQNHTRLTFCIYKENVLPEIEYQWKDAWHIHIDDAVNMDYMRLTVGDEISFKDSLYKIVRIGSLEAFYFQVCLESMIRRNRAWAITGKGAEDMLQGIIEAYRQHPGWNKKDWDKMYSDFSQSPLPVFALKSYVNLEYGQLMRVIMDDSSVIIREYMFPTRNYIGREYVVTYTALVEMYKLGINLKEFCGDSIIVPHSVVVEAEQEADVIYKSNNREIVASLSVQDEKVQLFESEEEVKRENIRQAMRFKNYVSGFSIIENKQDMIIQELQNEDITEVIGICDYDALMLAHTRGAVLITGEMLVAGFTKLDAIKADVAGIADFLCLIGMPIMKLFDVMRQMFQYRFYAVITPTVTLYIRNHYDIADEAEKQEIVEKWNDVLQMPKNLKDENYRNRFKGACFETMRMLKEEEVDLRHPILQAFYWAAFYYNDYRINYYIENGTFYYDIVQIDREKEILGTGLSEEND